ncbi:MAG: hypothetical protein H6835_10520 [Planctomycetes bacterium]|nr:hypothetical protein [Planctomycetota bacterium]
MNRPSDPIDPSTTRLGQLQRGRGAGFVAALAAGAAAHDDVLRCVLHDPSVDPQLEDRARYYAELLVALDVPLQPLTSALDDDGGLAYEVLAGAWRLGHAPTRAWLAAAGTAEGAIAGVTSALWSREWATRVELPPRAAATWLRLALEEARCAEPRRALRSPVTDYDALDLETLLDLGRDVRHEQMHALFAALRRRDSEPLRTALAAVVHHDVVFGKVRLAARVLGALGDERLLDRAEELFSLPDELQGHAPRMSGFDRMRRAALSHYVQQLPPIRALQLARQWRGRGGYFETVVGAVLAEFATGDDRLPLETFVAENAARDGGWDVIHELDALGRLGDPRSAPLLVQVAAEARYAHARRRAVHALAMMPEAPGAAAVLREALWDCEDEAAADGCAFIPELDAAATTRVTALSTHPLVAPELQQRARRRLDR